MISFRYNYLQYKLVLRYMYIGSKISHKMISYSIGHGYSHREVIAGRIITSKLYLVLTQGSIAVVNGNHLWNTDSLYSVCNSRIQTRSNLDRTLHARKSVCNIPKNPLYGGLVQITYHYWECDNKRVKDVIRIHGQSTDIGSERWLYDKE